MIRRLPETVSKRVTKVILNKRHNRRMYTPTKKDQLAVTMVTSWSKQCGIATYSEFLSQELKKITKLCISEVPTKNALNPIYKTMGYGVGHSSDLVHVQFEYGIFPSLKLGRRTLTAFAALPFYLGLASGNRRLVTTVHEPRKTVTASGRSGLLYTRMLDNLIFSTSDLIIVHTQESKRLMQTVYDVEAAKLKVIPHGSYQQPKFMDKNTAKAKLGLSGKTVVTVLGFVTPKKGHDLVIPLMPKIDRNVQLVIAGGPQNAEDARYLVRLKKMATDIGCADRVTFTGYLEDLSPILNATDIAVLPYRNVTESGVLHLLVAYRVPTLASDLAAFREVYDEFGCLELFKAGDSEDLYGKLEALLSDEKKRAALKAKCVDMWNATNWSSIANRHLEVYQTLF